MQSRRRIPSFLRNLHKLLEDQKNAAIISWNALGDSFHIKNIQKFSEQILPEYFKHKNFSSFIRQLNMYDFHKVKSDEDQDYVTFQNKLFKKHKRQLMANIERKEVHKHRQKAQEDSPQPTFDNNIIRQLQNISSNQTKFELKFEQVLSELEEFNGLCKGLQESIGLKSRQMDQKLQLLEKIVHSVFGEDLELK